MSPATKTRLLLTPIMIVMIGFMILPMLLAVFYSAMTSGPYGGVRWPFSADGYIQILFQRDFDNTLFFSASYVLIILRSVLLAILTALACFVIGLPVAWYIVCQPPRLQARLMFLTTLPFWINTLVRTYIWVLILRDQGLLNQGLVNLGLTQTHFEFLYNDGAILLGMVYTFLPFMILPIFATLERLDPAIIEAAHDLYADRIRVFLRIVWPLAKPGAAAGFLLTFAPALGSFLAPDLLGGGKRLMIGSLIQLQFTSSRNWPFGAALATVVTAAVLLCLLFSARNTLRKAVGK